MAASELGEQVDHEQNCGSCPSVFIADGFVAILHKGNKNVAIDAIVLLFCTIMLGKARQSAESNKPEAAPGGTFAGMMRRRQMSPPHG